MSIKSLGSASIGLLSGGLNITLHSASLGLLRAQDDQKPAGGEQPSLYLNKLRDDEEIMAIINAFLFMRGNDD